MASKIQEQIKLYKAKVMAAQAEKKVQKAETIKYKAKKGYQIGERKGIKRREKAVRGVLTAAGVIAGSQTYSGAGRPRGSFKHGMPIQVYKKMMREKKAKYQQYQQEQYAKLQPRGFTPEQIQQLQQQQALQELEQPSVSRVQQIQQRVQQMQIQERVPVQQPQPTQIIPQPSGYQKMKVPTNFKGPTPSTVMVDDELRFRKWSAETTISPNTQRILDSVRRIQNKGKADNIEMQRRVRERNMVGRSMNLMKAHENMIDTSMDFTGVPEDNILLAPSVFKEIPENFILRKRGTSILDTKSTGNSLFF